MFCDPVVVILQSEAAEGTEFDVANVLHLFDADEEGKRPQIVRTCIMVNGNVVYTDAAAAVQIAVA